MLIQINLFTIVFILIMIKRNQDRLSQQIKQIQTLFKDFKKMLNKCRQLAQQLKAQLPNDSLYSSMERTIPMKVNLLDINGLVNLKNSIAKTTSQLFDRQRQFTYRKQKKEVKEKIDKEFNRMNSAQKHKASPIPSKPVSSQKHIDDNLQSLRSSRSSDLRQSKSIQIPIYKAKVQTAEGKMDRIAKYIASLKKNIKANADSAGNKWRVRDYLLCQPTYLNAKTLLERYLMRQQQIDHILQSAVNSKLLQYFNKSADISKDEHFYYVKIKKQTKSSHLNNQSTGKALLDSPQTINKPLLPIANKLASPTVQKQVNEDFQQMKADLQKKSENYADLFVKMNQVVEKGSERLNQIRQKRKQAFQQDDELWDQL